MLINSFKSSQSSVCMLIGTYIFFNSLHIIQFPLNNIQNNRQLLPMLTFFLVFFEFKKFIFLNLIEITDPQTAQDFQISQRLFMEKLCVSPF